jgi:hypothetical protein
MESQREFLLFSKASFIVDEFLKLLVIKVLGIIEHNIQKLLS